MYTFTRTFNNTPEEFEALEDCMEDLSYFRIDDSTTLELRAETDDGPDVPIGIACGDTDMFYCKDATSIYEDNADIIFYREDYDSYAIQIRGHELTLRAYKDTEPEAIILGVFHWHVQKTFKDTPAEVQAAINNNYANNER